MISHGHSLGSFEKGEVSIGELERLMAGGQELAKLEDELQGNGAAQSEDERSEAFKNVDE